MALEEIEQSHRRRAILELLNEAPAYTAHEALLGSALQRGGHAVSRDRLRADLAWLEEQGLILAQQPRGVWVATLTARGGDVAAGRASCPGLSRPLPRD